MHSRPASWGVKVMAADATAAAAYDANLNLLRATLSCPMSRGVKMVADEAADAAYDVAARALATEARGAAGDRVLSPEEQAERERTRMEMLEKERCVWGDTRVAWQPGTCC